MHLFGPIRVISLNQLYFFHPNLIGGDKDSVCVRYKLRNSLAQLLDFIYLFILLIIPVIKKVIVHRIFTFIHSFSTMASLILYRFFYLWD